MGYRYFLDNLAFTQLSIATSCLAFFLLCFFNNSPLPPRFPTCLTFSCRQFTIFYEGWYQPPSFSSLAGTGVPSSTSSATATSSGALSWSDIFTKSQRNATARKQPIRGQWPSSPTKGPAQKPIVSSFQQPKYSQCRYSTTTKEVKRPCCVGEDHATILQTSSKSTF